MREHGDLVTAASKELKIAIRSLIVSHDTIQSVVGQPMDEAAARQIVDLLEEALEHALADTEILTNQLGAALSHLTEALLCMDPSALESDDGEDDWEDDWNEEFEPEEYDWDPEDDAC